MLIMVLQAINVPGCDNCIIDENNILQCMCRHQNDYYLTSLPMDCCKNGSSFIYENGKLNC